MKIRAFDLNSIYPSQILSEDSRFEEKKLLLSVLGKVRSSREVDRVSLSGNASVEPGWNALDLVPFVC